MPSMLMLAVAMLAGSLSLSVVPVLPHPGTWAITGAAAVVAATIRRLRIVGGLLAGLTITGLEAQAVLDDRLLPSWETGDVVLSARIVGFPVSQADVLRMTVEPLGSSDLPVRIRLTWVDATSVPEVGETWRLTVRLRRPGGYSNPHGFDFDKWLLRERIGATGYVIGGRHHYRVHGEPRSHIDRIRARAVQRIDQLVASESAAAVLMAIAVGARHRIGQQQWDDFAATGTSHLMAISGLHIGLSATSAYCLLRLLFAVVYRHRSARAHAFAGASLAAGAYTFTSGMGLPALRALLMVLIGLAAVAIRRNISPLTVLAAALIVLLVADPLSPLSAGFRLSFSAVAILFLSLTLDPPLRSTRHDSATTRFSGVIRQLPRLQIALLVGLFPLTIVEFNRVSLAAPLINLLVMPVFSFIAVPAALVGVLLDGPLAPAGNGLIWIAGASIDWPLDLISVAGSIDSLSIATASPIPWPILVIAPLGVLCPRGLPGKGICFVCLFYAMTYNPAPPPAGCVDIHTLDVGQGLAVVARTHNESVLYDTGPSFRGGGGTAELVVRPFLQSLGLRHLDRVVLSHDDLDHAGGINALLESVSVGRVVASTPGLADITDIECVAGLQWSSSGVTFRVLHPRVATPWEGNNASCVLEIRTGGTTVLLPGDIEEPVERLMAYRGELPKTDVLVVPHHGSRTSSSDEFVSATRPAIAIVASGWKNRWGFPKPEVVNRWEQAGAIVLNTATDGAISIRACADGLGAPVRNRARHRRYWHEDRKPPS